IRRKSKKLNPFLALLRRLTITNAPGLQSFRRTSFEANRLLNAFLHCNWQLAIENCHFSRGVLDQLVERLNGIEEVRGSTPLGSKIFQEILESIVAGFEQMPVVGVRQIG